MDRRINYTLAMIVLLVISMLERYSFISFNTVVDEVYAALDFKNCSINSNSNEQCQCSNDSNVDRCSNKKNRTISLDKTLPSQLFYSAAYFFPLFGGLLHDGIMGSLSALVLGGVLELLGFCFTLFMPTIYGFIAGLCFVAIGGGFFQAVIPIFAAEQVLCTAQNSAIKSETFFMLYFWFLSIGEMLGYVTIYNNVKCFQLPILTSLICMVLAVALLLILYTTGYYKSTLSPSTQRVKRVMKQFVCCISKQDNEQNLNDDGENEIPIVGEQNEPNVSDGNILCRFLPFLGLFGIYYLGAYQAKYLYKIQVLCHLYTLDENFVAENYGNLIQTATVMIFLPFLILLQKYGYLKCPVFRIGCGMLFSVLSLLAAFLIEYYRKFVMQNGTTMSKAIGWLYPQFFLAALSDTLAIVAGSQIVWEWAPRGLKSMFMGLFVMIMGVSGFFDIAITKIFEFFDFLPSSFNESDDTNKLQNLFIPLIIACFSDLLLYFVYSLCVLRKRRTLFENCDTY